VSILKFAPISQTYQQFGSALLFAGFWDGNIIIYQAQLLALVDQAQTQIMLQGSTGGVPILGAIWCIEQVGVLLACADNNIKKWDLQSNKVVNVGSHAQPVKDLYMFHQNNTTVVVSGGWDSRVKFWSWANPNQLSQVGESILEKPIQYMSGEYPLLVTAHSGLKIHYWDLKKIFSGKFDPQGVMTSPLKESTSCIQCFADGKGYIVGSIEGRCGVKYIDLENNKINTNDDFCFKSHHI
jgi:mRNA export factor